MSLNIKNPEADSLARELAEKTGESITEVVINALRERLAREEGKVATRSIAEEIHAIAKRCSALPDLDTRTPDEIIGYDEHGAFKPW